MALVAVVEVRADPPAFPGRLRADLAGAPALARTLARVLTLDGCAGVACVAPPGLEAEIAAEVRGVRVVRARGDDPLARLTQAARATGAETILRIVADRVGFDASVAARTLAFARDSEADFGCNTIPRLWPQGLEVETFPLRVLIAADRHARHPYERAHPTAWMRAHPELRRAALVGPGCGFELMRFGLEGASDLAFLRALYADLGPEAALAPAAVYAAHCLRRPDLMSLNAPDEQAARQWMRETAAVMSQPQTLLAA